MLFIQLPTHRHRPAAVPYEVGRRPQHAASKLACLPLSSARSCPSVFVQVVSLSFGRSPFSYFLVCFPCDDTLVPSVFVESFYITCPGTLHFPHTAVYNCRALSDRGVSHSVGLSVLVCDVDHVWSYGVREVVSSIPDRGNIVGWVFHPTRWLVSFVIWTCLSFKILNLFRTLSSWGSSNYRPSAPFLYEVASHVKNCHSGHYYYYYYVEHTFHVSIMICTAENLLRLSSRTRSPIFSLVLRNMGYII